MSTIDILIAAAHENELRGLGFRSSNVQGLCVQARAIGVGAPDAAVGATRALAELQPRALILLGSCGVYRASSEVALLTPIVPDAVQLVDAAVIAGEAAYPDVMTVRAELHAALGAGLADSIPGSARGTVATTLGITTSDGLAEKIARGSGCAFENLEALAVARACEAFGVAFAAVLVVTNVVGSRGRFEWRANHGPAADSGGGGVRKWIEAGAVGLPR